MIKHLLTLIWNQRSGNVWIFLELLLVTAMLWVMADSLLVDAYTYRQPLGYDITNTYSVEFNKEFDSSLPDSLQTRKAIPKIFFVCWIICDIVRKWRLWVYRLQPFLIPTVVDTEMG